MIVGAHVIIYTKDAEADRDFFREAFGLKHVDVGGGWLIFALPPAELAFHPSSSGGSSEFYLMCDDIESEMARLQAMGRPCEPVSEQQWGRLTRVTLPGGGTLAMYQPKHALAHG